MRTHGATRWFLLAMLLALGLLAVPAQATPQEIRGNWDSRADGDRWRDRDQIQLNLELQREGDGRWQMGFNISIDELRGLTADQAGGSAETVTFQLVRDAGTLSFDGQTRDGRGTGFFSFEANPSYMDRMAELGYPNLSADRVFTFAVQDVTVAYVIGLRKLGYDDLPEKDLVRFAIHNVELDFIRQMNALGYVDIAPGDLVKMKIHDVTPEYVRRVREALGSD